MFYNTYYEIFMPFCFYKLYQRIIRQHLYKSIKYIPMKNTTIYFKCILMKYNNIVRLQHKVSISLYLHLLSWDL